MNPSREILGGGDGKGFLNAAQIGWLNQNIGGFYPQNGWCINNGSKPYVLMDDLGGFPIFLVQHPIVSVIRASVGLTGCHDHFVSVQQLERKRTFGQFHHRKATWIIPVRIRG